MSLSAPRLGRMISSRTRASRAWLASRLGENAPIPPVFGPVSPSPTPFYASAVDSGRAGRREAFLDDDRAVARTAEGLLHRRDGIRGRLGVGDSLALGEPVELDDQ